MAIILDFLYVFLTILDLVLDSTLWVRELAKFKVSHCNDVGAVLFPWTPQPVKES